MGYKIKTNKTVAKRFKVTATGKLKCRHAKTSHLMSARTSKTKRQLGRPGLVYEPVARNMRRLMRMSHLNPIRTAHERAVAAKAAETAAAETK